MANEYHEWARHFTGGWGKIPLQKSKQLRTFKLVNCNDDGMVDIEIITAKRSTKLIRYPYSYVLEKARWYFPESKYVNTDNDVVRCVAQPRRQWQKSLTLGNCHFASARDYPTSLELRAKLRHSVTDVLNNYLDPYPTYQECVERINSGKALGAAFSKRWMVSSHPELLVPVIVYKNQLVGYDYKSLITCIPEMADLDEIIRNLTGCQVIYSGEAVNEIR